MQNKTSAMDAPQISNPILAITYAGYSLLLWATGSSIDHLLTIATTTAFLDIANHLLGFIVHCLQIITLTLSMLAAIKSLDEKGRTAIIKKLKTILKRNK